MSQFVVRSLCIAAIGLVLSWVLLSGSSPASDWLIGLPLITNIASAVNLPTMLFALACVPGSPAPADSTVAVVGIAQWLGYGFAIAWICGRLWPNNSSKPNCFASRL